jgi:hypothetical protein
MSISVRDKCEARDVLGSRRGSRTLHVGATQRAWQHVAGDAEKNGASRTMHGVARSSGRGVRNDQA